MVAPTNRSINWKLHAESVKVFVQRDQLSEKLLDPLAQLRAKGLLGEGLLDHTADLTPPAVKPLQRLRRCLLGRTLVGFGGDSHTGSLFRIPDQLQEFFLICRPVLTHLLQHGGSGSVEEKAVMDPLRVDLKVQAGEKVKGIDS